MTENTRPGSEPEVDPIPAPENPEPLEPGDAEDDELGASTVDEDTVEDTDAEPRHRRPDER